VNDKRQEFIENSTYIIRELHFYASFLPRNCQSRKYLEMHADDLMAYRPSLTNTISSHAISDVMQF